MNKIACTGLAALLALGLAGCGERDEPIDENVEALEIETEEAFGEVEAEFDEADFEMDRMEEEAEVAASDLMDRARGAGEDVESGVGELRDDVGMELEPQD
jgi:hypothetical protein